MNTLFEQGYRREEDAWNTHGRHTYQHDDEASRSYLATLKGILAADGWRADRDALRTFRHDERAEIIEIEPGGADCSGHYLHHMKASA